MITPANDNPALAELMRTVEAEQRTRGVWPLKPIPSSRIIAEVEDVTGVCANDLLGTSRYSEVVSARRVLAGCLRRACRMSFPEVAQAMRRRHHSSTVYRFYHQRNREEVAAIEEVLHRVGVRVPGGVPMQEEKG